MASLRLSVGVARCGHSPTLDQTLACLLGQEREFDQIVVADDQDSPSSAPIPATYRSRVQVVPVPSGLTPAQQWNRMAPHLNGEWISLLTSEDCARPNFARAVEDTVTLFPGASILRAGWMRHRDNGRPGEVYTLHSVRTVVKPADALFEQRIGPKGSFTACSMRRECWEKAGRFPEETPLLGDWSMWLLAGALGDTVRSREVIAEHRTESAAGADASRKTAEMREMYLIYRDILPRASAWAGLDHPTWIASASRKRFRDVAIAASNRFGPHVRTEMVQALRPWAESVEQQQLLQRFASGERIRDFNLGRRVKPAIKRVISAVR